MKRNLFYGLLSLLLFAGCGKDSGVEKEGEGDEPAPEEITLELSVSDLVFEAAGGVKTFGVACNGEWKIEGAGEWCVVDTDAGNGNRTVSVTAAAYEGMEDRNVNLTVKAGDKAKVVGVTQKRKDAVVLSKDKLEVAQEGGTLSVEVKSNIDYEVTVPEEFGEWITLLPDSKAVESRTYRFAIGENDTPESRRGYIVFAGNAVKDTVYVYQAQKDRLLLEQDSYDAAADGETFSVELKTNVDYEVKIPADADWVSRVETRALRTDRLTFAVAANEGYDSRSTKVVIQDRNGNLDDTLYLRQFGKAVLLLDKVNIDVPAVGGTVSVEARSNMEYEIVIPEDFDFWISRVPETRALTAKVFNFRIGRNSGYELRTGYIVFTGKTLRDTVYVVQTAGVSKNFTETISGVSFDMVYVQGGTFRMGAAEEEGSNVLDWEKPIHSVTLSDYYIGKHEVTQGLWKAVMGNNPSDFANGDNYPVENVSWNDVQEFLSKLNQLTGKKYVLPTEAQWEYAARGGTKSQGYKYSGSNTVDDVAWYGNNSERSTHPVGTKLPNELGIYDMSGNVFEWCNDWFGDYSEDSQIDPIGPDSGSDRVIRGGNFGGLVILQHVSFRFNLNPDVRSSSNGFRVALAL